MTSGLAAALVGTGLVTPLFTAPEASSAAQPAIEQVRKDRPAQPRTAAPAPTASSPSTSSPSTSDPSTSDTVASSTTTTGTTTSGTATSGPTAGTTATAPDWCNPPGRAIGERPTALTGQSRVDAYLWIKRPGESDGTCNGGPAAGTFWDSYAIGLVRAAA